MLSIRKIGVLGRTYRHLNRYRQILGVLFKYGFGDVVDLLRIEQYIEIGLQMISRKRRERVEKHSRAERIRMAFEELGPTYVKLGQVLSTRPDLIPVDFLTELTKLQDRVPAFPFSEAREIFAVELGSPPEVLFDSITEAPIASASIAQVHRARLFDGDEVAVKIQRPGIGQIIEVDLEIMLHLATLMERHIEELSLHRPVKIVEEFARTLEREIDFTLEAANMERFSSQFIGDPTVYVPKVYRQYCTPRILTTEFVDGIKISEIETIDDAGLDRRVITARGAQLIFKQIFDHGFFHADPHPGNLFVLPGNIICPVDFGMIGAVDRITRERFVDLIDSVVHRDATRITQALLALTHWEQDPDIPLLEKDVTDFCSRHLFKPLKEIQIGRLLQHIMEIVSHHQLRIPPDIFLMMKAITAVEGVALMLDPDFDMIAHARPFVEKVRLDRFAPPRIAQDAMAIAADALTFLRQFPRDLLEITRIVRQQKLAVRLDFQGLSDMLATHDQISNRISFSIIIASLIIGSALIIRSAVPPFVFGFSLIGVIGFLAAAIMGIWLLVAILKKGKL
jgi:ubiquinone biosynthesis protein